MTEFFHLHVGGPLARAGLVLALALAVGGPVLAHSPVMDADVSDWCHGAASTTRTEDSASTLTCGHCSSTLQRACNVPSDCPGGETCINVTTRVEIVWWDDRTDGAVNDLRTVAVTQDDTSLYVSAELWVDPDPVSLPFGELGIDFRPGGSSEWHDPGGVLTNLGHCSIFTDRGCSTDTDCHFCAISTEPSPSTRLRPCGSGCNPDLPGDTCDTSQTCVTLGNQGPVSSVGRYSSPTSLPDYLVVLDFSRWLVSAGDSAMLMKAVGGSWVPGPAFITFVNPGASGGSGGPPGKVEFAIPWTAFGCTGSPGAYTCPDFGPDQDFRFVLMVARGTLTLDYAPDGAIEDVMSEPVAATTSTTADSCPAAGIAATLCEIHDGSQDALVPRPPVSFSGRVEDLRLSHDTGASITLSWSPSCFGFDTDHVVYEGDLTALPAYSHLPAAGSCTTGGLASVTITPATGDRYYLVVPNQSAQEGSYGQDGADDERPASTGACLEQATDLCPPPPTPKTVFVTSVSTVGDMLGVGGLAGGDAICADQAAAAGLVGIFKAWLSDATVDAASRLTQAAVPYALPGGTIVASNWSDLTDGSLLAPINEDELGALVVGAEVWTGSLADGVGTGSNCRSWTNNGAMSTGTWGKTDQVGSGWSEFFSDTCGGLRRLYCLEQ